MRRRRLLYLPGIDDRHTGLVVIASITSNDCEAVVNRCRRNDQVWLRESVSRFSAILNQKPPLEHNVFGDLKNTPVKHGTNLVGEPIVQLGAVIGFVNKLDAESNFGKSYRADMKVLKGTIGDEGHNSLVRLWPAQF